MITLQNTFDGSYKVENDSVSVYDLFPMEFSPFSTIFCVVHS